MPEQSFIFPSWEQDVEFEGRLPVAREPREVGGWRTWDGVPNQEEGNGWRFMNEVLTNRNSAPWTLSRLRFRDPDKFVAGGIHNRMVSWQRVLEDHPKRELIFSMDPRRNRH